MRVLICDDTEMIRRTMRMFLEKDGHEIVAECASGEEAVEKYPEAKPDFCLLDIAMPGMDGIVALKKIYALDPNVKAIMCTGREDQTSMIQALQSGALGYVEKPFNPTSLREAIAKIL